MQPGSLENNLISSPSFFYYPPEILGKDLDISWNQHHSQARSVRTVSQFPPPNPSAAPCSLRLLLLLQPHSASNTLDSPLHLSLCPHSFPHVGAVTLSLSPANSYFKPQPRIVSSGGSSPDPIKQLPEDPKFPLPSHQVPLLGG